MQVMEKNNENYSSMNLQTIPNVRRTFYANKHDYMDVTDIVGARPRFVQRPRHYREVFYNRNDDIEKSRSNIIIPKTVNKPDRQLQVDDISGARTKVNKFTSTRNTNPLNPAYQLPQVQYAPFPEPKFIKDNMSIDDIQGTRMKETFALKLQRQGKFIQKDQSLLQQKPKLIPKKDNFLLDVSDINMKEKKIKGERCTNPLEPVYKVPSSKQDKDFSQIGPVPGSKPSILRQRTNPINFNLSTQDIPGAIPKPKKPFTNSKAQQIPETKTGSLKRGISSNRKTNPLQPDYTYLGSSQQPKAYYSRPKTAAQRLDAFLIK